MLHSVLPGEPVVGVAVCNQNTHRCEHLPALFCSGFFNFQIRFTAALYRSSRSHSLTMPHMTEEELKAFNERLEASMPQIQAASRRLQLTTQPLTYEPAQQYAGNFGNQATPSAYQMNSMERPPKRLKPALETVPESSNSEPSKADRNDSQPDQARAQ